MKQKFLPSFFIAAALFSSNIQAQKNTAFAVTGASKGNFTWNVIREIDLSTGEVVRTIYDPTVTKNLNYRAVAGTELSQTKRPLSATGNGVAAVAFDGLHNRLYFTNMHNSDLMY